MLTVFVVEWLKNYAKNFEFKFGYIRGGQTFYLKDRIQKLNLFTNHTNQVISKTKKKVFTFDLSRNSQFLCKNEEFSKRRSSLLDLSWNFQFSCLK